MKIEIDIDIPKGYRFVRYGLAKEDEKYIWGTRVNTAVYDHPESTNNFIVEKIEPRRIILEEVVGTTTIEKGQYYMDNDSEYLHLWRMEAYTLSKGHTIWRRVDE